jgi:hypothetical protein
MRYSPKLRPLVKFSSDEGNRKEQFRIMVWQIYLKATIWKTITVMERKYSIKIGTRHP